VHRRAEREDSCECDSWAHEHLGWRLTPKLSGIFAAPRMSQDRQHAECGPKVRLNDWFGGTATDAP
jgi:hypothetical protein